MNKIVFFMWLFAMLVVANSGGPDAAAAAVAGIFIGTAIYWAFGRERK